MVAKNIVSDYGAAGDGVSDDAPEFYAFNVAMQGVNVDLTIPAGTYYFNSNPGTDSLLLWAKGIPILNVIGAGSGSTTLELGPAGSFALGGKDMDPHTAITDASGISARIQTVSAGATSVALTAASAAAGYISRFQVGRWMCVTGYDLQGLWQAPYGFPPNFQYFEYVQITAVDTGAKTVSFTPALRYTYRDTWPLMNEGVSIFELDAGGPATIIAMDASWDTEVTYSGLTIDSPVTQIKASGRIVTYQDCVFPGNIPFPSVSGTFRLIDCDLPAAEVEADKLADTVILEGGTHNQWKFQSASIRSLQIDGTTITGSLIGTPLHTVIENATLGGLLPGAITHGKSETLICRDSTISSLAPGGFLEKGEVENGVNSYATMSNGVITIPNTNGYWATRAFAPGAILFWSGLYETQGSFRVLAVTQDATNVYVHTTWAGGFPDSSLYTSGKLYIRTHPCPSATFENCVGCADVVDQSQVAARGRPLYTYSKREYTGDIGITGAALVRVWGRIVSAKVNVLTAYTGAQSTLTVGLGGQFNNFPTIKADESVHLFGPRINLKTAGERVLTPGGNTGIQSGDSGVTVPEAVWLTGSTYPSLSADISGESSGLWPVFTVEYITDQGAAQTVAPLRMRLRAA